MLTRMVARCRTFLSIRAATNRERLEVTQSGKLSVVLLCVAATGLAWALPSVADFDLNTAMGVWHMNEGEGDVAMNGTSVYWK